MATAVAVVVTAVALAGVGAGSARAALRWSAPELVDGSAPFGAPFLIGGVSCPTATFCLGVGNASTVVTATGTAGPKVVESPHHSKFALSGVSCASTKLCVAYSRALNGSWIWTTTNPTAPKPTWKRSNDKSSIFEAIDCPTASLCVAEFAGIVLWSTNPTGGASTWHQAALGRTGRAVGCAPGGAVCVVSLNNGFGGQSLATSTNPAGGKRAWTTAPTPRNVLVTGIDCPSTGFCVGISRRTVLSSSNPAAGGSSWSATPIPGGTAATPIGIGCGSPSPASCIVALSDGSLLVGSGSESAPTWTRTNVLDPDGFGAPGIGGSLFARDLIGSSQTVGCRPASCLVPDQGGRLVQISLPAPSVPSPASVKPGTSLAGVTGINGLSCPSASECILVDDAGGVSATTAPTGPASAWHRRILPGAAARRFGAGSDTDGLNAISCPSTSFCVAVGNRGTVATSSSPASVSSWTSAKLPFKVNLPGFGFSQPMRDNLTSVSCPSVTLCVATGTLSRVYVSTRPAGGPGSWRVLKLAGHHLGGLSSVACPSATLCIAGGDFGTRLAVSGAPTRSWKIFKLLTRHHPGRGITAVTCAPGSTLCLVGTSTGVVYISKDPARGRPAFRRVKLAKAMIDALGCGSPTLCVAVDRSGHAWSSADPAAPRSRWHAVRLDPKPWPHAKVIGPSDSLLGRLRSVACTPSFCVVGDAGGQVFVGR